MGVFPSRTLFRPVVTCPRLDPGPRIDGDLADWEGVPPLPPLAELDGQRAFAQVYLAWSKEGLYVAERCAKPDGTVVVNRHQPTSGDGLQVWVDTRATQTAHRATRFCHHFILLPKGGGPERKQAMAWQANIRRASDRPPLCRPSDIRIAARIEKGFYTIEALLPTPILHGFEPRSGARIAVNYLVHDVPGGRMTWSAPAEFPVDTDPSLWGVVELGE